MKKRNTKNCIITQMLEGRSNSFLINQEKYYTFIDIGRKNSWKEITCKLESFLGDNYKDKKE